MLIATISNVLRIDDTIIWPYTVCYSKAVISIHACTMATLMVTVSQTNLPNLVFLEILYLDYRTQRNVHHFTECDLWSQTTFPILYRQPKKNYTTGTHISTGTVIFNLSMQYCSIFSILVPGKICVFLKNLALTNYIANDIDILNCEFE